MALTFTTTRGAGATSASTTALNVAIPPKVVGDFVQVIVKTTAPNPTVNTFEKVFELDGLFIFQKYVEVDATAGATNVRSTVSAPMTAVAQVLHASDDGTVPTAPAKTTRLLTQFHDTAIVDRMEAYTGLRYEGSTIFNDAGGISWGDIAAPWFATTEAGKPRAWRTANPTVRGTFCVTQAPFPAGQVAQLLNGSHQSDVDACLTAIVTSFGPAAIVRLGHEMDSWVQQYHWGYGQVSPADYIAAFRYWHARAVALGFTQLRFDVCYLMDGRPMGDWYPGDDVVDIISVDMYGSRYGSTNPTEAELVAFVKTGAPNCLATLKAFCEAHDKPYAFPEWGMFSWQKSGITSRGSGDHPAYANAIFDFIAANDGTTNPTVYCAYQSYFNRPDGGVEVTLDGDPGGTASHLAAPNLYAQYRTRARALRPDLVA